MEHILVPIAPPPPTPPPGVAKSLLPGGKAISPTILEHKAKLGGGNGGETLGQRQNSEHL